MVAKPHGGLMPKTEPKERTPGLSLMTSIGWRDMEGVVVYIFVGLNSLNFSRVFDDFTFSFLKWHC